MADIFITGHRNPDMDSIAAAYSYAVLKNQIDKDNRYIPCALGPLNRISKALFERLSLSDPLFLKDAFTRVSSISKRPSLILSPEDPVYELVNMYNQSNPSVVPIIGDEGEYLGLLSVDDINRYFLRENTDSRPVYDILLSNIPRVLHGHFIRKGVNSKIHAPVMVGAMRFEVFRQRLSECVDKPLLVVGCRKDHIEHAISEQLPGLILTGVVEDSLEGIDFSSYKGFVYASSEDTAETLRLLRLSVAVESLVKKDSVVIYEDMLFDSAKGLLIDSDKRGLPVFDKRDGVFKGFITRRCFLNEPRKKIIMVDHNEAGQSVPGLECAEIEEIIDHHRLDAPKTRNPITIISSPVGSTCTIIYSQFERYRIVPDEKTAKVLLAGLVSDTVMLKSPTTTIVDRATAKVLCELAHTDIDTFSRELFSEGSSLSSLDESKAISSDFKMYSEKGVHFGIGQVEVTTLEDIESVKEKYLKALDKVREREKLNWAMLLVTNVLSDNSILFSTDYKKTYRFIYEEMEKGIYNLPGVLSRKKQLLPEVLRVLEG